MKAAEGDLNKVKSLIEEGTDVNIVDPHSGVSYESVLLVIHLLQISSTSAW